MRRRLLETGCLASLLNAGHTSWQARKLRSDDKESHTRSAYSGNHDRKEHSSPSSALGLFDDPEVVKALPSRKAVNMEISFLMRQTQPKLRAAAGKFHAAKQSGDTKAHDVALSSWQSLLAESERQFENAMYPGAPRGSRRTYLEEYGCAAWTEPALLAIIAKAGPRIVEIGAGGGQWKTALEAAGADVLAFDNRIEKDTPQYVTSKTKEIVLQGDERKLQEPGMEKRALLLVYPPQGPMAANCVRLYSGDVIIFVGEGRSGVNADSAFFDLLEDGWKLECKLPLAPFPGGFEKLYIVYRKKKK